jgi:hypothetical protein
MRTPTTLVAATTITAGTIGFAAAPRPGDPAPYTPAREAVTKTVQLATDSVTMTPATVDCLAGKVVVSGGYHVPTTRVWDSDRDALLPCTDERQVGPTVGCQCPSRVFRPCRYPPLKRTVGWWSAQ